MLLVLARLLLERLALLGAVAAGTFAAAGFTELARYLLGLLTSAREWSAPKSPPPVTWAEIIKRNVPLVDRLNPQERARLDTLIRVFLDDVRFEGCEGLELTEEIRVTIAAQACLLLVNLRFPWYPKLRRVLVYPDTFVPRSVPLATHEREQEPLLGEAWSDGSVVLSWRSARRGALNPFDGHNVVLHEFAHVLDSGSGAMDGVPPLEKSDLATWAYVLHRHYARLLRFARKDRPASLDHYGAASKAEFFAVATETFFEKPQVLKRQEPELYDALCKVYRQDTAATQVLRYGAV